MNTTTPIAPATCDRCCAPGKREALLPAGPRYGAKDLHLVFCQHHWHEHEGKVTSLPDVVLIDL